MTAHTIPPLWFQWTNDERVAAVKGCAAGQEGIRALSRRAQVTEQALRRYAEDRNIDLRGAPVQPPDLSGKWYTLTDEERDRIAAAPRTRLSTSIEYGVDPEVITRYRRKRGITPPVLPQAAIPNRQHVRKLKDGSFEATVWSKMTVEQRIEHIQNAYANNVTRKQIITDLQCGLSTLTLFMRKHNVIPRHTPLTLRRKSAWHSLPDDEKKAAILAVKDQCNSITDIGRKLEIDRSSVSLFASRHGITLNFPRKYFPPRTPKPKAPNPALTEHGLPMRGNIPGVKPRFPEARPRPDAPGRMPSDTPTRTHMLDARLGQCKFPLWSDSARVPLAEMFYCGAPVDNPTTSYCTHCRAVISRPMHPPRPATGGSFKASIRRS